MRICLLIIILTSICFSQMDYFTKDEIVGDWIADSLFSYSKHLTGPDSGSWYLKNAISVNNSVNSLSFKNTDTSIILFSSFFEDSVISLYEIKDDTIRFFAVDVVDTGSMYYEKINESTLLALVSVSTMSDTSVPNREEIVYEKDFFKMKKQKVDVPIMSTKLIKYFKPSISQFKMFDLRGRVIGFAQGIDIQKLNQNSASGLKIIKSKNQSVKYLKYK